MEDIVIKVKLCGTVPEVNQANMTFEIRLSSGCRMSCSMPEKFRDIVIEAFNKYSNNTRVVAKGIGRYDRHCNLVGLDFIDYIALLNED